VRWLKLLARLPHTYRTWLGDGHTIPNGDPPQPLSAGSRFVGFVVGHAASLADDDEVARTASGKVIQLYAIYPLHADELTFKLERGWGELADRLAAADVSDVIEPDRRSVVATKPKRR
jgi:Suppressor of fused protein (SUFU)